MFAVHQVHLFQAHRWVRHDGLAPMLGAVLVVRPMGSSRGGTRPSSSPAFLSCPFFSVQTQEGGVDTMDASAAVPAATLDRWLLEEALAALPPVCLLILSASHRAWLILLWKKPQAAGQQVVQALILVRQSLPLSPGMTRMRAGEHMQQAWCQSLSPSYLTQKRRRRDAPENRDGPLYTCFLSYIVCVTDASSSWTAAGEEQGEATPCQR